MPLAPGARLGPYEVFTLLGSGGMGEVYKARDLRLGRSVALKVIHADFAQEPVLRERFEREARAVSSLNHPHICTLYDVGQHEGSEFLVMEFVEGQTLADRLTRGPLPLDLAIRYAVEIAKGLDHAHRHGITHRDLKPANVILSRTGAKLLDFGLAKLRDPAAEATRSLDSGVEKLEGHEQPRRQSTSNIVTAHGPLTDMGTVLGTFEYMAPEQVEGREADERTDIFAFGALVYEAVTGLRAFEGSTRASLIGAVLMTEPPPMRERQPEVPLLLDQIVRRCLSKDPEERWQSVRDLLLALQWVADGVSTVAPRKERTRRGRLIAALVLAAVTIALLVWNLVAALRPPAAAVTRWDVPVPSGETLAAELLPSLAVSPDGLYLVFRAESGSVSRLYIKRLDEFEPRPIEGSDGAYSPFFSADSKWVGFLAKSKIYRAPVTGGSALLVADAQSLSPGSPGVTWGPDGTIVFAAGGSGLMRVSEGGAPSPLTKPDCDSGEVAHIAPQFLPGGRELLFSIRTTDGAWRVAVLSLDTGRWDELLPRLGDVAGARYVTTGHLIYARAGSLFARPLDVSRRAFTGPPRPLSEPVYTRTVGDAVFAQFAVSDSGGLLANVSGRPSEWTLVSVRPGEAPRPLGDVPRLYRYPRVSPDGSSVAVSIEEERTDIYVVDTAVGRPRKLTDTGSNTQAVWMPDSQRVTFSSRSGGSCGWDLYTKRADGGGAAEKILERDGAQFATSWLKSGPQLAFYELTNTSARDVLVWFATEKRVEKVAATNDNERGATFSPDGRLLAYISNASGRDEIYVQAYPGQGAAREIVSVGGGTEPVWSPSPTGYELFYRNNDRLFAVTIRTEPRIAADTPRVLFTGSYVASPTETGLPNYDVFPDGRTFVMVKSAVTSEMRLRAVQNPFEPLRTSVQP